MALKIFLLLLSVSLTTIMAGNEDNVNVKAISLGNNQLTKKLYPLVASDGKNLIMSPLSAHTILSLVAQGAEGDTDTAMRAALQIPEKRQVAEGYHAIMTSLNNAPNVTLNIANVLYVKEGYKMNEKFAAVAKNDFLAEASNIDFTQNKVAAKTINTWVEERTNNKIQDLISADDLDADTRMVLVNAIYFKGNWASTFNKELTKKEAFYSTPDSPTDCEMMHKTAKFNYKEDAALNAQIVQLPYENKDISMIIVLPKERDGIKDLEKALEDYDLSTLTNSMSFLEVELSLPKFKIESKIDLNEPLTKIGLGNMFSDAANFSGLLDGPEQLKVSKVVQKAFIEVNEEGTEAAAATGITMMRKTVLMHPDSIVFAADHPFIFYLKIGENILFNGKLNEKSP